MIGIYFVQQLVLIYIDIILHKVFSKCPTWSIRWLRLNCLFNSTKQINDIDATMRILTKTNTVNFGFHKDYYINLKLSQHSFHKV